MSWPAVGEFLSRRAKSLRADTADSRAAIQQNDLKQLKQIVSTKLSHIKKEQEYLPIFLNLAAEIKKTTDSDDFLSMWRAEEALTVRGNWENWHLSFLTTFFLLS